MSIRTESTHRPRATANDRLKRMWGLNLWASLMLAAAFHVGTLVYWPQTHVYTAAPSRGDAPRIVALAVPGVQNIAAAPEEIVMPDLPTVETQLELPEDMLIGPLPTFADPALEQPIAPPVYTLRDEWLDYEHFAPFMIAPSIRNQTEMRRFLERHYVPILEMTGAQGIVQVHFWITEDGGVSRAEVAQSSGSRSLDRLAVRLSQVLRFSPALRLGRPVRVMVRLPIVFRET